MEQDIKELKINGVTYVPKDFVNTKAEKIDGMGYVICRTYSAGVFAGYLSKRHQKEVTLRNARRIWQWYGAASLSQLAVDGTSQPDKCKFPCVVDEITLTEAIEIIPCTQKAKESIEGVEVWKA